MIELLLLASDAPSGPEEEKIALYVCVAVVVAVWLIARAAVEYKHGPKPEPYERVEFEMKKEADDDRPDPSA